MNVRADVDKPGETVTHKADNRNTQPERKQSKQNGTHLSSNLNFVNNK